MFVCVVNSVLPSGRNQHIAQPIRTDTCWSWPRVSSLIHTHTHQLNFDCLCAGILAVEAYHAGSIRSFLCPQADATTRKPSTYTLTATMHQQPPRLSRTTHLLSACQCCSKAGVSRHKWHGLLFQRWCSPPSRKLPRFMLSDCTHQTTAVTSSN